jgi:hypothetical protein
VVGDFGEIDLLDVAVRQLSKPGFIRLSGVFVPFA